MSACSVRSFTGKTATTSLDLLLARNAGLSYDECAGVGYQQLHDDPDGAIADIVARFHAIAERCDAVVIVGSDYTDVVTPTELSVNARIAANLVRPSSCRQ